MIGFFPPLAVPLLYLILSLFSLSSPFARLGPSPTSASSTRALQWPSSLAAGAGGPHCPRLHFLSCLFSSRRARCRSLVTTLSAFIFSPDFAVVGRVMLREHVTRCFPAKEPERAHLLSAKRVHRDARDRSSLPMKKSVSRPPA